MKNRDRKRPDRRHRGRDTPPAELELRNPHAVLAVLNRRPADVREVRVREADAAPAWKRVLEAAADLGRPVRPPEQQPRETRQGGKSPGRGTFASAIVAPVPQVSLAELLASEGDGLWLALEHVQDPHNLGAIIRTAGFFGVRGVILTKDRSASLTAVACDTAAGGAEATPVCTVTNLSRTIDAAREAGLWVLGTSEHAEADLSSVSPDRRWLAVVGNEEHGLRRLTREKCDALVSVGGDGPVGSLNVSVAAGIVMHALAKASTDSSAGGQ